MIDTANFTPIAEGIGINTDGEGNFVGLWFNPDRVETDGLVYVRLTTAELSWLEEQADSYPEEVDLPDAVKVCIEDGDHLLSCDEDGYCDACGWQDNPEWVD